MWVCFGHELELVRNC